MTTILERIRNKAQQAIQGIGNFIDRDKSIEGVQLIRGGLGNQARAAIDLYKQRPSNQIGNRIFSSEQYIPTTPRKQEILNRDIEDILGKRTPATTAAQGFNNWFASPLFQVQHNLRQAGNRNKSTLSRIGSAAQAGFGLLPGVDDAVFAGYNAIKNASAKRDISGAQPGLAGTEFSGLGDAVTGEDGSSLSSILNIAELPLLLLGGIKARGSIDNILKSNLKNIDDVLAGQKYKKRFDSKGPDFIAGKSGVTPVETLTKKESKALLNEFAPLKETTVEVPQKLLSSGKQTLLLSPPQQNLTIAQLRSLARKGDNLEGVTFNAKNVDEAREAINLGLNGKNIEIVSGKIPSGETLNFKQEDDLFANLARSGKQTKAANKYFEQVFDPAGFLKKSLPEEIWNPLKKTVFDRLGILKGEAVDFKKGYQAIIKGLGNKFLVGTEYSKLTQQFGEGVIKRDQLVKQVGETGAAEIESANTIFRRMYDEIIDIINANRQLDGLDLITKRKDYYRHMKEMGEGDSALSRILSAGSQSSSPQSSAIFKERTGDKTTYDAVGGMLNYLEKAGRAGFTDRVSPLIGKVSGYLKKQGADPRVTTYLDDFSDQVLGISKGSNIPDIVNKFGSTVRTSRVVGNVSSIVSQGLNIPLGANVAGWKNYLTGLKNADAISAVKKSPFLKDRGYRVPASFQSKLGKKAVAIAGGALQDADQIATVSIWKGFYQKGKSLGVDDVIQYADDQTKAIVGGRGIGDFSKWQQTKLGQILTPFTVEVQAQANKIVSLIGEKEYGILLGVTATNFLVNEAFENVGPGYRPLIDPVDAIMEAYELQTGSDKIEQSNVKAAARIAVEVMGLSPILQAGVSNAYSFAEATGVAGDDGVLPSARDLGIRDMTRFNAGNLYNVLKKEDITGNAALDQILTTTARLLPGGNQALKTAGAVRADAEGAVKSRKGNVLFETSEGLPAKVRRLLFGKWADKNADKLFGNDFNWGLTTKQTEIYDAIKGKEDKTEYLENVTRENIGDKQLDAILTGQSGISGDSIGKAMFKGKSATSTSIEERTEVYKELIKALDDENLPQSYKDSLIKASGASQENVDYYTLASKDQDVRLQEILPKLDNMDDDDLVEFLMMGRRVVAGKQLVSSSMVDYLYERDYISEDAKEAIKALKYDEIKDEFYFKKSFGEKGKGKKLTYNQARAIFNVKFPKISSLKSIDNLLKQYTPGASQTDRKGDILLSSILNSKPPVGADRPFLT